MIPIHEIEGTYLSRTIKLPKTKGQHTIFSSCISKHRLRGMMRKMFGYDRASHEQRSLFAKTRAQRFQALYEAQLDKAAIKAFGRKFEIQDYRVSGVGRDEFSDSEKKKLRRFLQLAQNYKWISYAHQCAT